MRDRMFWAQSAALSVLSMLVVGSASAEGSWGSYDCIDADGNGHGEICCVSYYSDFYPGSTLKVVHPEEYVFSSPLYKIQTRANCNQGEFVYGPVSTDNNCGGNCEESVLSGCPVPSIVECRIDYQ